MFMYVRLKRYMHPFQSLNRYWRLLSHYLRPQWRLMGLLAVILCSSICVQVVTPLLASYFIDEAISGGDLRNLTVLALLTMGLALAGQGLAVADTYVAENVSWTATNALRADLVAHLLRLDATFHTAHTPGELIERVDGDIATLARFFSRFVVYVLLRSSRYALYVFGDAQSRLLLKQPKEADKALIAMQKETNDPEIEPITKVDLLYYQAQVQIQQGEIEPGDRNIYTQSLLFLGSALDHGGQSQAYLQKVQQAKHYLNDIVLASRSKILSELAYAYAQNGEVQEALKNLDEAQSCFSDDFGEVPCFVSANCNRFQLILFEGMTYLALGMHTDQTLAYNAAASQALEQIEKVPSTLFVPDRTRFEIVNYRAEAALGERNMEKFVQYFLEGAEGAEKLGSQKRWQEVCANWKAARRIWPNEGRVWQLAERLF